MTERIAVGDLVVIVRPQPCCGANEHMGQVFRVGAIANAGGNPHKKRRCNGGHIEWHAQDAADGLWAQFSVLKRIPPLSELEGQRTEENLKEPA